MSASPKPGLALALGFAALMAKRPHSAGQRAASKPGRGFDPAVWPLLTL